MRAIITPKTPEITLASLLTDNTNALYSFDAISTSKN